MTHRHSTKFLEKLSPQELIDNELRFINEALKEKFPALGEMLNIKQSIVEEFGYGLFAKKFIPKKMKFDFPYTGYLKNSDVDSTAYYMYVKKNVYIDASHYDSCHARYMNDHNRRSELNCKFIPTKNPNDALKVQVKLIRDIYPGEELFCSYGKEYSFYEDI